MRYQRPLCVLLACTVGLSGCLRTNKPLAYLGDDSLHHYVGQATKIDHAACVDVCPNDAALATDAPRTIRAIRDDEVVPMSLATAIHVALQNATVIRSNATFGNSPILANGAIASTVHDPAIQQSNVVGNSGVEAALSAFDTDFTTAMTWGRNEQVQNSPFSPAGFGVILPTVATETAAFQAGLTKRLANGGALSLTHDMNYQGVPPGLFPFPSAYSGNVRAGYRQPLWAGGGVEYTRIAGPINANTAFTQNVIGQGVLLSRINENVSLDDFEAAVRDLVLDVENVYWDLYLAYRVYHAAVVARDRALEEWRRVTTKIEGEEMDLSKLNGGLTPVAHGVSGQQPSPLLSDPLIYANEALVRDQYFSAKAAAERTLASIYATEVRLRRLLGLAVNNCEVIRPSDEPLTAEYQCDWHAALAEAMCERLELRRQKWNVKRHQLQLLAAKRLVNPRLDFVSSYNVNAFGDQLIGLGSDDDAVGSPQGLRYAYESLTQGNQTGWTLGFEFSMPIGFRHAHTQVRNVELQLVKARDVLAAQELEVSHELASAIQLVDEHYQNARTNLNRYRSAVDQLKQLTPFKDGIPLANNGVDIFSRILQAQTSIARAEQAYFTSLVEYQKAIANLQYRKGTLLEFNRVFLTEGAWDSQAYEIALRRARSRSHALNAERLLHTEPGAIAVPHAQLTGVAFPSHEAHVVGEVVPVPDDVGGPIPLDLPTPTTDDDPNPVDDGPVLDPAGAKVQSPSTPANPAPPTKPAPAPRPVGDAPVPLPFVKPPSAVQHAVPRPVPSESGHGVITRTSAEVIAPSNTRQPVLRAPSRETVNDVRPPAARPSVVRQSVYEVTPRPRPVPEPRHISNRTIWHEQAPSSSPPATPIPRPEPKAERAGIDFAPLWREQ